jgi:hypothetical protein
MEESGSPPEKKVLICIIIRVYSTAALAWILLVSEIGTLISSCCISRGVAVQPGMILSAF